MRARHLLLALGVVATGTGAVSSAQWASVGKSEAEASKPVTRSCADRVESTTILPDRERDTVIGPVAFYLLPKKYYPDETLEVPPSDFPEGFPAPPLKTIAVVKAGARATVRVPRWQRRWLYLNYSERKGEQVRQAVTFEACRRVKPGRATHQECGRPTPSRPTRACRAATTQFNGAVVIDYARAPNRGRCASLIVRREGADRGIRRYLFRPASEPCPPIRTSTGT